ncbi:MAG TPA: hypothetical protein VF851_10770 [Steroidobacteraceae bacterium]
MTAKFVTLVALLFVLVGSASGKDGAPSRLFPYYEEDTGVLRLGQAVAVATRSEIVASGSHYQFLLSAGIGDADLGDGRLTVVRVYCCGGRIEEEQSVWAYVPPGISVEAGDFVELQMGRVPGRDDPGVVNKVTAVRQKNLQDGSGPCRWEPDNPSLWMRIVYCDGIDRTGWVERKGIRKMWFKPVGAVSAAPASVAPAGGMDCFFVTVRPNLRKAVQAAAAATAPPTQIRFEGEAGAEQCERTLDLAFNSVVDRSSQQRNQSGAAVGGLASVLLGSITPWSCPTTHSLSATVGNRSGGQIVSYQAQKLQKRVGTMLACGDVEEPADAIVTELVGEVLRQMAAGTTVPGVERTAQ